MRRFQLSRRRMLRSLAVGSTGVVGLPLLETMLNDHGTALATGEPLPLRFLMWYWADGVVLDLWEPTLVGDTWELSPQLAPLAPVKDYVSVVTGMLNRTPVFITHHEGMTGFSGYAVDPGFGAFNSDAGGPTVDQRIADAIQVESPLVPIRAVHVQVSKRISTDGDGGTIPIALSHRGTPGSLTPQIPSYEPQAVWATLFSEYVPRPDDSALRISILDKVKADAERLEQRLGMADRARLEAHLDGVRELEQRITALPPLCEVPGEPNVVNLDVGGAEPIGAVNTAMAQLIRYAFECDVTRVATFMFKRFVSSTTFTEAGLDGMHHAASHFGPQNNTYRAGIVYMMERFSELLQLLAATPEPTGGNLLDSTIVYASSDCSTGFSHSVRRQPVLLAGRGRGYLRHPGIHAQTVPWNGDHGDPNAAGNIADVLLTCLQAFDPTAESVGEGVTGSSTPFEDVLA